MEFSKCSLRECIGVLRMAAATSIVRIPTQVSRMRQVLSDIRTTQWCFATTFDTLREWEDSRACAKSIAVRQGGVGIGASRQGAGIQRATVQKSA